VAVQTQELGICWRDRDATLAVIEESDRQRRPDRELSGFLALWFADLTGPLDDLACARMATDRTSWAVLTIGCAGRGEPPVQHRRSARHCR
jgi:hypothetical protein